MFSLEIFIDARGNLWSIYKIQAWNVLLMFVCFPNDFPKCAGFFPCALYCSHLHCPYGWRSLLWCQKYHQGYISCRALFALPHHLPDSSKIHFSVWAFPFIPIKTKPAKFPPPSRAPVLKRQQPPALVLSGMKRGHRSCKAAQTCEMGFTRCSATSGVAMYDSVCTESRKGKSLQSHASHHLLQTLSTPFDCRCFAENNTFSHLS